MLLLSAPCIQLMAPKHDTQNELALQKDSAYMPPSSRNSDLHIDRSIIRRFAVQRPAELPPRSATSCAACAVLFSSSASNRLPSWSSSSSSTIKLSISMFMRCNRMHSTVLALETESQPGCQLISEPDGPHSATHRSHKMLCTLTLSCCLSTLRSRWIRRTCKARLSLKTKIDYVMAFADVAAKTH